MKIKPIETVYKGYKFRSRLEARWAVFFDALGIEWEYEPEGYLLDNGERYLPDFVLYDIGGRNGWKNDSKKIFVEVKGTITDNDIKKWVSFSEHYPLYIVGNIPKGENIREITKYMWDQFMESKYCSLFSANFIDGDSYGVWFYQKKDGSIELWGPDNVSSYDGFARTYSAYTKARQARFEHGETI